ncbi:LptF/LptG family permease [Acetobacteraceae bacterium]|nr:LptF/LptG family permease [Acetobacteraceae bacterium]
MPSTPSSFKVLTSRFNSYIFLLLMKRLVFLTFAGVLLIWTIQSLHFVGLVSSHGMSLKVFFQLTSFLLPTFLNIILPLSTFAVILFTYERLTSDRELTILQGSGLSPAQLSLPAILCAFCALTIGYSLTLFAVPAAYHAFHKKEFHIRNELGGLFLEEGVFNRLPNGMTIYVQDKDENDFKGALIEQTEKSGERIILMAESGTLLQSANGLELLLKNGSRQTLNKNDQTLSFLGFGEKMIAIAPPPTGQRSIDAQELSLSELLKLPQNLPPVFTGKFYAEAYERLASPLYTLAFSLIALCWTLCGPPRGDRKPYRPVLFAVFSMALLLSANLLLRSFASLHPDFGGALLALPILPILIALFILFKHSGSSSHYP